MKPSTQGLRVVVRREQSQEFSVPAHGFFGNAAFSETLEASDLFASRHFHIPVVTAEVCCA